MSNMQHLDLEDPLLDKQDRAGGQRGYPDRSGPSGSSEVNKEGLSSLFEPDHIREGTSVKQIESWGGTKGLMDKLKVDPKQGLDNNNKGDLDQRGSEFGKNDPIIKKTDSIFKLIFEQFEDKVLQILSAAAFVSLIIGVVQEGWAKGWLEGATIFIAVVIIVSVTAINNYMRDKQFQKLNSKREQRNVPTLRNGKITDVNIYELVVGDILQVNVGDNVPVDGVLIKSSDLSIDESSITGESDMIRKHPLESEGEEKINPFMISGSKVMEGTGLLLVCAVGVNTQQGKSKLMLQEEPEITPLQLKLESLVDSISKIGKWAAFLTFGGMVVHLFVEKLIKGEPIEWSILYDFLEFFIVGVTIIVVAIPEGLPLAVTIALAYSVGKMKDENNLVRYLSACETMGGANNVCTDKTGTLTQNKMNVQELYIGENVNNLENPKDINEELAHRYSEAVCANSTARPEKSEDGNWKQVGNKTECALIELANKFDCDYQNYRDSDNNLRIVPFSSKRKMMSTVWKDEKNETFIYCKGASEMILEKVTKIMTADGQEKPLDENAKNQIKEEIIGKFAKEALRTIGIGFKKLDAPGNVESIPEDQLESDLTLVAIAGIKDPLRPEIPDAVETCKRAGITVRMVTGDNTETAMSIAKHAGILDHDYQPREGSNAVMEGKVFRQKVGGLVESQNKDGDKVMQVKNLDAFKEIEKELRVLARSSPEDKYILVTGLKQLENVVAVTGDGTNDAPALKKADIGFAMGIEGTEVAKEAAGIIILDDNFSSIITAVKWGRNIFDCVRKFLQFQLTVNVVAMFMVFLGGVVLRESPFTPIQMLWVNLIMDTFASLALATEPPSEELLQRKPYSRRESLLTPAMYRNIMGQALFQIGVLVTLLFAGDKIFGIPSGRQNDHWDEANGKHYTIVFNTFVFMQIFNFINARKLKTSERNVFANFFNNKMFILIEILIIVMQAVFVEFGGFPLRCSRLNVLEFAICVGIGMISLIVAFLFKLIPAKLFRGIKWLRDDEMSKDRLAYTTQTSYRKSRPLKKYRSQASYRSLQSL